MDDKGIRRDGRGLHRHGRHCGHTGLEKWASVCICICIAYIYICMQCIYIYMYAIHIYIHICSAMNMSLWSDWMIDVDVLT